MGFDSFLDVRNKGKCWVKINSRFWAKWRGRTFPSTKTMQENIGTCYSIAKFFLTLRNHMDCSMQALTISWSLPKFMSIALVMPSNHLIVCDPLLLLPSIFLNIRVFSNESAVHIRWPKYWSFLPKNIQGWFPVRLTVLTSSLSKGLSRVLSNTTVQKHQFFGA